jgi:hypothetical protein
VRLADMVLPRRSITSTLWCVISLQTDVCMISLADALQNQEPFQELFLTHVPNRSCSTMELR